MKPLPTALVAVNALNVHFGEVHALRDVSFCVGPGECIALVGSNGSGKTTLLRALHGQLGHGLARATQRHVATNLSQAMVFQRPFFLNLSIERNLRIALWLAGVAKADRAARVDEVLQRVGLAEVPRHRAARTLSGGQQQRLAIGRALAVRPRLLFLDEPTASLDPNAKRGVEALIDAIAKQGVSIVMSTHNLGQAKRLATRVAYLEAGQVVCDLPTREFFEGSLPLAAAAFLKGEIG